MNEFPKDLQSLAFKISEYRDILSFKITIIAHICIVLYNFKSPLTFYIIWFSTQSWEMNKEPLNHFNFKYKKLEHILVTF